MNEAIEAGPKRLLKLSSAVAREFGRHNDEWRRLPPSPMPSTRGTTAMLSTDSTAGSDALKEAPHA